jgi:hypothetical protein
VERERERKRKQRNENAKVNTGNKTFDFIAPFMRQEIASDK